jgi:hypothetical protein
MRDTTPQILQNQRAESAVVRRIALVRSGQSGFYVIPIQTRLAQDRAERIARTGPELSWSDTAIAAA